MTIGEIIGKFNTTPFLFVGSGLTRRYLNLPDWKGLLKHFAEIIRNDEFSYSSYENQAKGMVCKAGILPKVAELIQKDFDKKWFLDESIRTVEKKMLEEIQNGISPFKAELGAYISRKASVAESYQNEIEKLAEISEKSIAGVITTNYDSFLEDYFKGFCKYVGQSQLIFSPIQGVAEIYKIHGCVTSPESLIVSSNDYANFKKRNAYLAAKLLTIFVEHPVIFLGYSISDPNILELLFSLKDCLAAHNIEKLKDRLIFVEWRAEQNEPIMIDGTLSLSDGKILPIKHIKINSFIPLFDVLANLKQRLPIKILRRFKDAVYEFVKTNEPTNKIYIGDLTNIDENGNDIEFVVGVGVANSIAKQGLLGICVDDVVEDVLFDNKHIPAKEFITDAIPKLLKKRIRIPLYKYYRAEHLLTNDGKLIKKGSAVINNYFKDKSQKSFYPSAKRI